MKNEKLKKKSRNLFIIFYQSHQFVTFYLDSN